MAKTMTLPEVALLDNRVKALLDDRSVSHAQVSRDIALMGHEFGETSVRRYRVPRTPRPDKTAVPKIPKTTRRSYSDGQSEGTEYFVEYSTGGSWNRLETNFETVEAAEQFASVIYAPARALQGKPPCEFRYIESTRSERIVL